MSDTINDFNCDTSSLQATFMHAFIETMHDIWPYSLLLSDFDDNDIRKINPSMEDGCVPTLNTPADTVPEKIPGIICKDLKKISLPPFDNFRNPSSTINVFEELF